ncbi:hypothetical protein Bbelb_067710 [Branchiostoma belcheri]|nr:hypothetical protein Bbelb_067710 [Branchiostoma belcheri]
MDRTSEEGQLRGGQGDLPASHISAKAGDHRTRRKFGRSRKIFPINLLDSNTVSQDMEWRVERTWSGERIWSPMDRTIEEGQRGVGRVIRQLRETRARPGDVHPPSSGLATTPLPLTQIQPAMAMVSQMSLKIEAMS